MNIILYLENDSILEVGSQQELLLKKENIMHYINRNLNKYIHKEE